MKMSDAFEANSPHKCMEPGDNAYAVSGWRPRVIQTRMVDSTRWDSVKLRDDDIIIATWGKCGTTLTQQIVSQLISGGSELMGREDSLWVDARMSGKREVMAATVESQTHRRFLKTHLPCDAVPFHPSIRYINVGRDARDMIWSLYNHVKSFTPMALDTFNSLEGPWPHIKPITTDIRSFYRNCLDGDLGVDVTPLWTHVQGWWDQRQMPNVLILHYANLIADLPNEMRRVARFLDIPIDEAVLPTQVAHCSIDYMREEERRKNPMMGFAFEKGVDNFFNKGTNGRWRDVLSEEEIARCDEVAAANLTPDCAHWLKTGEMPG